MYVAYLCAPRVKSLLSPQKSKRAEWEREKFTPPRLWTPSATLTKMQRFQEERQMLRSAEKKASSPTVCGWRKPGRKNRGRERKEGVGTGWDERARGEDAVPMVHQKLMPTASVSRSRSGKTTHANSLESPASALPPSSSPSPPRLLRPLPVLPLTLERGPSDQVEGWGRYELWHLGEFTESAMPLIAGSSAGGAAVYLQRRA